MGCQERAWIALAVMETVNIENRGSFTFLKNTKRLIFMIIPMMFQPRFRVIA